MFGSDSVMTHGRHADVVSIESESYDNMISLLSCTYYIAVGVCFSFETGL